MHQATHTLTLLPRQSRLINATEGLRLEVHTGCLWLTRPGDAVDRFLVAGDSLELHENLVLVQSDRHPGSSQLQAASYSLRPLQPARQGLRAFSVTWRARFRPIALAARSRTPAAACR